jgi:hypothetical protein
LCKCIECGQRFNCKGCTLNCRLCPLSIKTPVCEKDAA